MILLILPAVIDVLDNRQDNTRTVAKSSFYNQYNKELQIFHFLAVS
jgi:hypothetical protein